MGSPGGMGPWPWCIWRVARTLECGHKGSGAREAKRKERDGEGSAGSVVHQEQFR